MTQWADSEPAGADGPVERSVRAAAQRLASDYPPDSSLTWRRPRTPPVVVSLMPVNETVWPERATAPRHASAAVGQPVSQTPSQMLALPPGSGTTISQGTHGAKGARRTAKIPGVLLSELGRVPSTEEVEQVFLRTRVRDQTMLGLPYQRQEQRHTGQLGKVPKSTVSKICEDLRARYRAFRARSLAEVELIALFLDATYLPTRPSGPKEGVMVAWGYDVHGKRVLVDVCLGQRERYEDWRDMCRGLVARGLRPPLIVVDGAGGLNRTAEEVWPEAYRQRCSVHRLRNILAKLPKDDELIARVQAAYWAALDDATSPGDAEQRLRQLVGELERQYPTAAACLADDLPALTVHLHLPLHLRKRLRSTNLLERSLEEVRRRAKVIGRFPGETSCLSLCWAVLNLVVAQGRGLGLTDLDHRRIAELRTQQQRPMQTAEEHVA